MQKNWLNLLPPLRPRPVLWRNPLNSCYHFLLPCHWSSIFHKPGHQGCESRLYTASESSTIWLLIPCSLGRLRAAAAPSAPASPQPALAPLAVSKHGTNPARSPSAQSTFPTLTPKSPRRSLRRQIYRAFSRAAQPRQGMGCSSTATPAANPPSSPLATAQHLQLPVARAGRAFPGCVCGYK